MKSWSGIFAWSSFASWVCSSAAFLMMDASFLNVSVYQTLLEHGQQA